MTAFPPEPHPPGTDEPPPTDERPQETPARGPTRLRDSRRRTGQATLVFLLAVLAIVVLILVL